MGPAPPLAFPHRSCRRSAEVGSLRSSATFSAMPAARLGRKKTCRAPAGRPADPRAAPTRSCPTRRNAAPLLCPALRAAGARA